MLFPISVLLSILASGEDAVRRLSRAVDENVVRLDSSGALHHDLNSNGGMNPLGLGTSLGGVATPAMAIGTQFGMAGIPSTVAGRAAVNGVPGVPFRGTPFDEASGRWEGLFDEVPAHAVASHAVPARVARGRPIQMTAVADEVDVNAPKRSTTMLADWPELDYMNLPEDSADYVNWEDVEVADIPQHLLGGRYPDKIKEPQPKRDEWPTPERTQWAAGGIGAGRSISRTAYPEKQFTVNKRVPPAELDFMNLPGDSLDYVPWSNVDTKMQRAPEGVDKMHGVPHTLPFPYNGKRGGGSPKMAMGEDEEASLGSLDYEEFDDDDGALPVQSSSRTSRASAMPRQRRLQQQKEEDVFFAGYQEADDDWAPPAKRSPRKNRATARQLREQQRRQWDAAEEELDLFVDDADIVPPPADDRAQEWVRKSQNRRK